MSAPKPASPSTARAMNDRLALRLLQQEGPLTAAQLKRLTGLSRPTVADLVERLTAAGLVGVVGEAGEQRRGPNAKLYGIAADRARLAALDVRTEGVSVLVSDLVGRVLAEASRPIGGHLGTGPAVEQAVTLVERAAEEAGVVAGEPGVPGTLHTVGIGAPGLIDPATGELRDSTGLPEWHRRLVAALQGRFSDARVTVENETNLAAVAEQREGAATDRDTFVLLWLGHGTGAAVVLDGALRRGASGGTGEIGFLPVPGTRGLPSAKDCDGGFHSLAGSAAVVALAREHGVAAPPGDDAPAAAAAVRSATEALRVQGPDDARPGGPAGHSVSGAGAGEPGRGDLTDAGGSIGGGGVRGADGTADTEGSIGGGAWTGARDGAGPGEEVGPPGGPAREAAARFLDVLADRIVLGVASVVAVLDPGCVVLGGEVGQAGGAELADRVGERLRRMAPLATEVRHSTLGGPAVLRGALLTARESAQDHLVAPHEH
ncbi:ROK family transcriptional regulator [Streptomyces sp. bgisy159]|uniref:ROK family transcriptional regulator n=1 Tax=Streptomyces sp. bgisy159 TaxID=3413795 RepID=UPI003F4A1B77